jgi:hypothetical protein
MKILFAAIAVLALTASASWAKVPDIWIDEAVADAKVAGPNVVVTKPAVSDAKVNTTVKASSGHEVLNLNAPKSTK